MYHLGAASILRRYSQHYCDHFLSLLELKRTRADVSSRRGYS